MTYNYDVRLNNAYAFNGLYNNGPGNGDDLRKLSDEEIQKRLDKINEKIVDTSISDKKRNELFAERTRLNIELSNRMRSKQREGQKEKVKENTNTGNRSHVRTGNHTNVPRPKRVKKAPNASVPDSLNVSNAPDIPDAPRLDTIA